MPATATSRPMPPRLWPCGIVALTAILLVVVSVTQSSGAPLSLSQSGMRLIRSMYGPPRLKATQDRFTAEWVVGIGHRIPSDKFHRDRDLKITMEQAHIYFLKDIKASAALVKHILQGKKLEQQQYDALMSFVFGANPRSESVQSVAHLIQNGKLKQVPMEMKKFNYTWYNRVPFLLPRLVRRRQKEAYYWATGRHLFSRNRVRSAPVGKTHTIDYAGTSSFPSSIASRHVGGIGKHMGNADRSKAPSAHAWAVPKGSTMTADYAGRYSFPSSVPAHKAQGSTMTTDYAGRYGFPSSVPARKARHSSATVPAGSRRSPGHPKFPSIQTATHWMKEPLWTRYWNRFRLPKAKPPPHQYPTNQPNYPYPTAKPQYYYPTAKPQYYYPTAKPQFYYQTAKPQYDYPTAKPQYYYPTAKPQYYYPTAKPLYSLPTANPPHPKYRHSHPTAKPLNTNTRHRYPTPSYTRPRHRLPYPTAKPPYASTLPHSPKSSHKRPRHYFPYPTALPLYPHNQFRPTKPGNRGNRHRIQHPPAMPLYPYPAARQSAHRPHTPTPHAFPHLSNSYRRLSRARAPSAPRAVRNMHRGCGCGRPGCTCAGYGMPTISAQTYPPKRIWPAFKKRGSFLHVDRRWSAYPSAKPPVEYPAVWPSAKPPVAYPVAWPSPKPPVAYPVVWPSAPARPGGAFPYHRQPYPAAPRHLPYPTAAPQYAQPGIQAVRMRLRSAQPAATSRFWPVFYRPNSWAYPSAGRPPVAHPIPWPTRRPTHRADRPYWHGVHPTASSLLPYPGGYPMPQPRAQNVRFRSAGPAARRWAAKPLAYPENQPKSPTSSNSVAQLSTSVTTGPGSTSMPPASTPPGPTSTPANPSSTAGSPKPSPTSSPSPMSSAPISPSSTASGPTSSPTSSSSPSSSKGSSNGVAGSKPAPWPAYHRRRQAIAALASLRQRLLHNTQLQGLPNVPANGHVPWSQPYHMQHKPKSF